MEESRLKRKNRKAKRDKSYEGGSCKIRLDIQEKTRLQKRFSNKVPSKFSRLLMRGCLTLSLKRVEVLAHQARSQLVDNVAKKHYGDCLVGTDYCFGCGKSGNKVRNCLNVKRQDKGNRQSQSSGSNVDAPKTNRFYALCSRGEQVSYPDVMTDMLQVFSSDVYALLDMGVTFLFLLP